MNSTLSPLIFCFIYLFAVIMAPVSASVYIILTSAVIFYTTSSHKLEDKFLFILIFIPRTSFGGYLADYGTYENLVSKYFVDSVRFAGFNFSAGLILNFCVLFHTLRIWFLRQTLVNNTFLKTIFYAWFIGLIFSFISSFIHLVQGVQQFTGAFRNFMTLGFFFYAVLHIRTTPADLFLFLKRVTVAIFIIGIFASASVFHHRVNFIAPALAPPLMFLFKKHKIYLFISVVSVCCWFSYSWLGTGLGNSATFTQIFLFLVCFVFSILLLGLKIWSLRKIFYLSILAIPLYIIFVTQNFEKYSIVSQNISSANASIADKLIFKIFDDRANIWFYAWQDIIHSPLVFPNPGRVWFYADHKNEMIPAYFGAHNSYIHFILQNGFISGVIGNFFLLYVLYLSINRLRNQSSIEVKVLAVFILSLIHI